VGCLCSEFSRAELGFFGGSRNVVFDNFITGSSSLLGAAAAALLGVLLDITELSLLGEITVFLETEFLLGSLVLLKAYNAAVALGEVFFDESSRCLIGCLVPYLNARTADRLVCLSLNVVKTIFLTNRAFHYILNGEKKGA